jgi:hypothetical protein
MKGNVPIPHLPPEEEVWLIALVSAVRDCTARNGKRYFDAMAQNASGRVQVRIWQEAYDDLGPIRPGIWKIAGKARLYEGQKQFVATNYKPATLDDYRGYQRAEPDWPRAYTMDIETLALPQFRERAPQVLKRDFRLGKMRQEQLERYLEDADAEAERVYMLGSLSATTGRVVSIAVHVGPIAEFASYAPDAREEVYGIDERGCERDEREALTGFLRLMANFDRETDEIVGHNVVSFDLPFIFQRCLVQHVPVPPFINLGDYTVRGVYDTMRRWGCGDRRSVSLDDIAWALGFTSSKTDEVEGSKVFDLYHAGKLAAIREYNLNDVRLTRKVYERMVAVFGR